MQLLPPLFLMSVVNGGGGRPTPAVWLGYWTWPPAYLPLSSWASGFGETSSCLPQLRGSQRAELQQHNLEWHPIRPGHRCSDPVSCGEVAPCFLSDACQTADRQTHTKHNWTFPAAPQLEENRSLNVAAGNTNSHRLFSDH